MKRQSRKKAARWDQAVADELVAQVQERLDRGGRPNQWQEAALDNFVLALKAHDLTLLKAAYRSFRRTGWRQYLLLP